MPSSAGDNEKEYLVNLVKKKEMLKVLQNYIIQLFYRHGSNTFFGPISNDKKLKFRICFDFEEN